MSRLIVLLVVVSIPMLFIFGTLLSHWWHTDRDHFWMAISAYSFFFIATVMWFSTAKHEETDDDSEEHF